MRIKLAPWFTLFLSIIIIVSNLALFLYFKNSSLENAELRLIKSADNVIVEIEKNPKLFLKNPKDYMFYTTKNEFTSSGILVQFMDKNGDFLARSPSLKFNSLPFSKDEDDILKDMEFEDNLKLKVYQRKIIDEGALLGYAIFGLTTSQLYHNFDILFGILSIFTFVTIAILWLGINALISVDTVKRQQRFLSFASHELRTPLSVISGNAEVALRSPLSADDCRDTLSEIKNEAEWMEKLVSNLLLIFRSQGGVEKLNKKHFDLSELITNTASQIKKRYPTKEMTLNLPDESEINADPDQLKKVVNNLLDNAAKNTPPDGKIQINLRSSRKEFVLEVADNGIGIKKELQKNIFDAFYRIEQGKGEGSGLGLAIVKWVVDAHHGKVHVKSEEGHGTTFTVILRK